MVETSRSKVTKMVTLKALPSAVTVSVFIFLQTENKPICLWAPLLKCYLCVLTAWNEHQHHLHHKWCHGTQIHSPSGRRASGCLLQMCSSVFFWRKQVFTSLCHVCAALQAGSTSCFCLKILSYLKKDDFPRHVCPCLLLALSTHHGQARSLHFPSFHVPE